MKRLTLRDFEEKHQQIGGALILILVYLCQTLAVIPRGKPTDELNACLNASHLWNGIEKLCSGLPHPFGLVRLAHEIDSIISAEIPSGAAYLKLHTWVTQNFQQGITLYTRWQVFLQCPSDLIAVTITGNEGYLLYRLRLIADNGISIVLKVKGQDVDADNR